MRLRPRAIILLTAVVALVVFAIVQDRVTAAGARRYVALQRDALAGRGQAVTIDEIMRPAIQRSVQQGLLWAGVVLVFGVGVAGAVRRRSTLRPAQGRPELGRGTTERSRRPELVEGRRQS